MSIAIGLALGADQKEVAVISTIIILAVISLIDKLRLKDSTSDSNLMLSIEVDKIYTTTESLLSMVESICPEANIRRIDQDQDRLSVIALLKVKNATVINQFSKEFQEKFPYGSFSFIDDSSMPNE